MKKKSIWYKTSLIILHIIMRKPKYKFLKEEFPNEPFILISNHCGKKGPGKIELSFKRPFYFWGTYELTGSIKDVHRYLTITYYHNKLHLPKWLAFIVGTMVTPFLYAHYSGLNLIPTYEDLRFYNSIKETIKRIKEGNTIVIFPEDSSHGYDDEIKKCSDGASIFIKIISNKGINLPIFIGYFQKRNNTFYISEEHKSLELLKAYPTRESLTEKIRNKLNIMATIS